MSRLLSHHSLLDLQESRFSTASESTIKSSGSYVKECYQECVKSKKKKLSLLSKYSVAIYFFEIKIGFGNPSY